MNRRSSQWTRLASAAVIVTTTVCFGCGGGPPMAPVSGKVLLDGEPLRFGSVILQHEKGGQPARAVIQPDGAFVLSTFHPEDGARVGEHRIRVTCFATQDPAFTGHRGDSLGPSLIPQRYTNAASSGLTVTVKPSGNEPLVLELEGAPRRRR